MALFKKILFYIFPFLWALFFMCTGFIPERLWPNFHQALPLVLIIIFYFALFSPSRLNVLLVFILGLIADFLSLSVLGLHTFIYVGVFFITNLLQPYIHNLSFRYLWFVFCCLMFIADVAWAWLARLTTGVWVASSFWFVQYVFTCLCYPIITWTTGKLNLYIKDE